MKKLISFVAVSLLFSNSHAADSWIESRKVKEVTTYSDGTVMFLLYGDVPSGACWYYSSTFKFDGNTNGGKSMLSNLLVAQSSTKLINISYTNSTAPVGSNNTNGCTKENMAVAWAITLTSN